MSHHCPHPACGRSMNLYGEGPRRFVQGGGTYIFCPGCSRVAQVLSDDPVIYLNARIVGACSRCRRPIPQSARGVVPRCVVCHDDGGSMSLVGAAS